MCFDIIQRKWPIGFFLTSLAIAMGNTAWFTFGRESMSGRDTRYPLDINTYRSFIRDAPSMTFLWIIDAATGVLFTWSRILDSNYQRTLRSESSATVLRLCKVTIVSGGAFAICMIGTTINLFCGSKHDSGGCITTGLVLLVLTMAFETISQLSTSWARLNELQNYRVVNVDEVHAEQGGTSQNHSVSSAVSNTDTGGTDALQDRSEPLGERPLVPVGDSGAVAGVDQENSQTESDISSFSTTVDEPSTIMQNTKTEWFVKLKELLWTFYKSSVGRFLLIDLVVGIVHGFVVVATNRTVKCALVDILRGTQADKEPKVVQVMSKIIFVFQSLLNTVTALKMPLFIWKITLRTLCVASMSCKRVLRLLLSVITLSYSIMYLVFHIFMWCCDSGPPQIIINIWEATDITMNIVWTINIPNMLLGTTPPVTLDNEDTASNGDPSRPESGQSSDNRNEPSRPGREHPAL